MANSDGGPNPNPGRHSTGAPDPPGEGEMANTDLDGNVDTSEFDKELDEAKPEPEEFDEGKPDNSGREGY